MNFEEALKAACDQYMLQKKEKDLPIDAVIEGFREYLPALDGFMHQGSPIINLPAPGFYFRRSGIGGNSNWEYQGDDQDFAAKVAARKETWPQGTGVDGLISVGIKESKNNHFDHYTPNVAVEITFNDALTWVNNSIDIPAGQVRYEDQGKEKTEVVWLENPQIWGETYINASEHGRIRFIHTEDFGRFLRIAKEGEDERSISELHLRAPFGKYVRSVTPSLLPAREGEFDQSIHGRYKSTPLGEGSLTAFLKHMKCADVLDSIVREQ